MPQYSPHVSAVHLSDLEVGTSSRAVWDVRPECTYDMTHLKNLLSVPPVLVSFGQADSNPQVIPTSTFFNRQDWKKATDRRIFKQLFGTP